MNSSSTVGESLICLRCDSGDSPRLFPNFVLCFQSGALAHTENMNQIIIIIHIYIYIGVTARDTAALTKLLRHSPCSMAALYRALCGRRFNDIRMGHRSSFAKNHFNYFYSLKNDHCGCTNSH